MFTRKNGGQHHNHANGLHHHIKTGKRSRDQQHDHADELYDHDKKKTYLLVEIVVHKHAQNWMIMLVIFNILFDLFSFRVYFLYKQRYDVTYD